MMHLVLLVGLWMRIQQPPLPLAVSGGTSEPVNDIETAAVQIY